MGNHNVGRSMAASAEAFWHVAGEINVTQEQALDVLNIAGKEFIGADAEFDDEMHQPTALSRLVAIAFEATADERSSLRGETDDEGELWFDGPYQRFRNHFQFC